ncbi:MAG TPA: hypothetical protein PKE64_23740, partial [Anaerolineae bacterium]|nr:hypothetical protein [Anaerolineae bacterium]
MHKHWVLIIIVLLTGLFAACRETPAPPQGDQLQETTVEGKAVQASETATGEPAPSEPLTPLLVGTT